MEINDALVTAITRELLKRLDVKSLGRGGEAENASSPTLYPQPPVPIVISGELSDLGAASLACLEERFSIVPHSSLEAAFPENAEVLVTRLGVQALVRLSEGDAGCTNEGAALLWALLRGKKPIIVEEGIEWRRFKGAMTASLAARYASHERSLVSYGAVFVKKADLAKALSGNCSPKPSCPAIPASANPAPLQGMAGSKRVINELELMRLCPASLGQGQAVEIGSRDILTPLAEDYIAKMRISVSRVG